MAVSGELEEYRVWVAGRVSQHSHEHLAFGLVEEAGEVAGKFKRLERGDYGPEDLAATEFQRALKPELGDVLFYLVALADRHGWSIEDLLVSNMEKLRARDATGTVIGTGDDR